MSNSYVVQVLCFAWAVTLAEACRVGDSNFKCQIGSMALRHMFIAVYRCGD